MNKFSWLTDKFYKKGIKVGLGKKVEIIALARSECKKIIDEFGKKEIKKAWSMAWDLGREDVFKEIEKWDKNKKDYRTLKAVIEDLRK